MTRSIRILTLETFCTSQSATNMLTLLSETTVQYCSIFPLNIGCTMKLRKIHGNIYTPQDHADKEGGNKPP